MLKAAFNLLTRIHSRAGMIRRPGDPDIYSPCRITPSSFFRFQQLVEQIDVRGREYILPSDAILGQYSQTLKFSAIPSAGTFQIQFFEGTTAAIPFNATAADVQTAARLVTGLSKILVLGSFATGFTVIFAGSSTQPSAFSLTANSLVSGMTSVTPTVFHGNYPLPAPVPRRGDRIIDPLLGQFTITETIDMPDVGGAIMGFRCRCE